VPVDAEATLVGITDVEKIKELEIKIEYFSKMNDLYT